MLRAAPFLLLMLFSFAPRADAANGRIGVIAPLTGPIAAWGVDVKNVLLFANERLGENKFQLLFEDDQCLGRSAVTAAQKLVNIDRVDFAIVVCTESMLATGPIFEKAKTFVFAVVASGANIAHVGDYTFRTWPSDEFASALLAKFVATNSTRIGVLSEAHGYEQEFEQSFLQAAESTPLEVRASHFQSEETDFRATLSKLRADRIDGLFINTGSSQTSALILKQAHSLGIDVPMYGAYIPGTKTFQELTGADADGLVFVDAPSVSDTFTDEGKKLYGDFVAQFGAMSSSEFVFASTYEALQIFRLCAEERLVRPEQLLDRRYSGIIGHYSFDRNGDIVGIDHKLKTIVKGATVALQANDAAARARFAKE